MSAITPEAAAKHIAALLGMAVNAKKAQATDLKGPQVLADVVDEEKQLVCVIQFDFGSAGSTGAALSRIPAGAVQDAMKSGNMDENLLENVHEIANVLTVLTTQAVGRRTILRGLKQGKQAAADKDLQAFVSKAKNKTYMHVSVQGYPGGVFGFLLP